MNSSIIAQRSNQRFFFTALVVSLGLVVASGFFLSGLFSGKANGVDVSVKTCLAVMRTNGFIPVKKDNEIALSMPATDDIESYVYRSGVIIASCPAYTLKDYCAGTGCRKPGVQFTLKYKD